MMIDNNGNTYPRRETNLMAGTNVKYEDQNSDESITGRPYAYEKEFGTATFKVIEHEENKSQSSGGNQIQLRKTIH
jgi:hypothetical protein